MEVPKPALQLIHSHLSFNKNWKLKINLLLHSVEDTISEEHWHVVTIKYLNALWDYGTQLGYYLICE